MSVLLSWFIWLGIISFIPEKVPRYFLPIVPCFILFSGIGIETIIKFRIPSRRTQNIITASLILLLGTAIIAFPPEERAPSITKQLYAYAGLKEAGTWIAKNMRDDTMVISSSRRAIRYFSGIDFKENSGRLVPLPPTRTEWEHLLVENTGPLILEYSRWQNVPYLNPDDPSQKGMNDV